MRIAAAVLILAVSAVTGFAQLSTEQKTNDFKQLAALYAKQYGPYEWKRDIVGFDLMSLGPWLARVENAKDDLEFYEICLEYVASLRDAHSSFLVPSSFTAYANFDADIYDGKVLIDKIDRLELPKRLYPFELGDEIVSVDGRPVQDLIAEFSKYQSAGNARSTARMAADSITFRAQQIYPRAVETPDVSEFVIRRKSGALETYQITWTKTGRPLVQNGPVPSPKMSSRVASRKMFRLESERPVTGPVPEAALPAGSVLVKRPYRVRPQVQALLKLQQNRLPRSKYLNVRGLGDQIPVFTIPGFTMRLGRSFMDAFFTGTFTAGGYKIGYIRIPSFDPFDGSLFDYALSELDDEIAYLSQNTDGLIVDVMRNPGGYGCYAEEVLTRLMPNGFIGMGLSVRPTLMWVNEFYDSLQAAKDYGAPEWQIALIGSYLDAIESAFAQERGITGRLPMCTPRFERDAAVDADGKNFAYSKPIVLLTDEFTASAGDIFASLFQDAKRGVVVGWRTMGAGGNVDSTNVGMYSEGKASVTQSMLMRPSVVSAPNYPDGQYLENVGVRPDVEVDYMTADNLGQGGQPFIDAFTNVIVQQIKAAK